MTGLRCRLYKSPAGLWLLTAGETALLKVSLPPEFLPETAESPVLTAAALWLDAFFAGEQNLPTPPPLAPAGTVFQRLILELAAGIPRGRTCTYGEIAALAAEQTGHRASARAAGQALGANPLPFFIPCHRVVAKNGLGGYIFDPELKKRLLTLEGAPLL